MSAVMTSARAVPAERRDHEEEPGDEDQQLPRDEPQPQLRAVEDSEGHHHDHRCGGRGIPDLLADERDGEDEQQAGRAGHPEQGTFPRLLELQRRRWKVPIGVAFARRQ